MNFLKKVHNCERNVWIDVGDDGSNGLGIRGPKQAFI